MYTFSNEEQQEKWDSFIETSGRWFESQVRISVGENEQIYGDETIRNMSISLRNFSGEQPSVGGCLSGELTLSMDKPDITIPRAARIRVFVRVCVGDGENEKSNWMPQGRYFIDTREETRDDDGLTVITLHAYDAMMRAEQDYPNTTHGWPYRDIDVVREIASWRGMNLPTSSGTGGIDPRTVALMTRGYDVPTAPIGYSMREVLGNIAAMYGGNWVISYDGLLLLVPIGGIPPETNLLVTRGGDAIVFGGDVDIERGVRIYV